MEAARPPRVLQAPPPGRGKRKRKAGERPLDATGGHGGGRAGQAPPPEPRASAFPPAAGCAISAALAAMLPGLWWLVPWLAPLATLPAGAVGEEEAAMSGNPGCGQGATLTGRRSRVGAARPRPRLWASGCLPF